MARRPRRGNRRGGRPIRRPRIRGRTLPHTRPPPRGGRRPPMIPVKDREGIARMREVCAIAATVLDSLKPLVRPGVTTMDLEEAGGAGEGGPRGAPSSIAATVLESLKPLVRPGVTTMDLEEAGRAEIARLGARSACYGYEHGERHYPAHTCISVNEEVVHGIPSFKRVLREGDIVSLDVVLEYNGYVGDNAFTVPVTPVSPEVEKLLGVTREALALGIRAAQVGNRIGDISSTIQAHVERHGFSVVRDMVGHGVGVAMHEPPEIPNFGRRGTGEKIRPGMTFAIEPMVNLGGYATRTLPDGW